MKLFIAGATGRVGTELLRMVREAGHDVTVLAREPSRCIDDERLHIVKGDILDRASILKTVGSQIWDAVVNVVGADPPWIRDGPTIGRYRRKAIFPGGMKTIHPGDVAGRIFEELQMPSIHRGIEGIWY